MPKKINQILMFQVGRITMGMDVDYVSSIVKDQKLTPIPNSIDHVVGVTYLHGECIPVYSLRSKFHLGKDEVTDKSAVLMAKLSKGILALPIDSVSEIANLGAQDLQGVPTILNAESNNYLDGVAHVNGKLISLVDPNVLIPADQKDALDQLLSKAQEE